MHSVVKLKTHHSVADAARQASAAFICAAVAELLPTRSVISRGQVSVASNCMPGADHLLRDRRAACRPVSVARSFTNSAEAPVAQP